MCKTNPCQNGGSCTELDSGFQCSCLPGYRGKRCQGILIIVDVVTFNLAGSYSFSKAREVPKGLRREMRKANVGRWEGARRKEHACSGRHGDLNVNTLDSEIEWSGFEPVHWILF